MKTARNTKKNRFWLAVTAVCMIAAVFALTGNSQAGDDYTPSYATSKGLPNVMFIFDNSNSMQASPYPTGDGSAAIPDFLWRDGYNIENNVIVGQEADKFAVATDTAIDLSDIKQNFTDVIGRTITKSANNRIYDGNTGSKLDGISDEMFLSQYKFRIVDVEGDGVDTQQRTITNKGEHNAHGLYWTVSSSIDFTDFNNKQYTFSIRSAEPGRVTHTNSNQLGWIYDANIDWSIVAGDFNSKYSGAILKITAGPNTGEERTITNYNVNTKCWKLDSALPNLCDYTTRYQILEVSGKDNMYAYGGNHPESKLYQAKDAVGGFLDSNELVDINGEYKLNFGFATYMSARIPSVTARYYKPAGTAEETCQITAYYLGTTQTSKDFWNDVSGTSVTISGYGSVSSTENGNYASSLVLDGVNTNGSTVFYRKIQNKKPGDSEVCKEQNVRFTLTGIEEDNNDFTENRHKFHFESDEYENYPKGYTEVDDCSDPGQPKSTHNGNANGKPILDEDHPCYSASCACKMESAFYSVVFLTTFGDHDATGWTYTPGGWTDGVKLPARATGPIDKDTNQVTPISEYDGYRIMPTIEMLQDTSLNISLSDYPSTDPLVIQCLDDTTGEWSETGCDLNGSETKRVVLNDVTTWSTDTNPKDVPSLVLDTTYFAYPGESDTSRPHGWSYKKTDKSYVYKTSSGVGPPDNSWKATWGTALTFPSDSKHDGVTPADSTDLANDYSNHRGDDQIFFVDLPKYDANDLVDYGDDVGGSNITKIKDVIGLGRVESPSNVDTYWGENGNAHKHEYNAANPAGTEEYEMNRVLGRAVKPYVYTMMPYKNSLPVNLRAWDESDRQTPMGATLLDAKVYFEEYIKQDALTQAGCRNNFIILLTDGLEKAGGDPVAAATALANAGVRTFVIGFGMDPNNSQTLNDIAVAGDTTEAYFAQNTETLIDILLTQILQTIIGSGSFTQAAPTITRTLEAGDELKMYYAYYDYPLWRGHLRAFNINESSGEIGDPVSGWSEDCFRNDSTNIDTVTLTETSGTTEADSDAGCQMLQSQFAASVNSREVKTSTDTNSAALVDFKDTNLTAALKLLLKPPDDEADVDGDGSYNEELDTKAIINYVRDPGYGYDGTVYPYAGSRDPEWFLGDSFMSAPVVVTNPKFVSDKKGYPEFKEISSVKNRPTVIYLSSNDGMLHAIDETNGNEKWSYIPNCVLGKLYQFKDGQRFTTDGPVTVGDLDFEGDGGGNGGQAGTGWHTVLVGGMGRGERYYYALDVTDPDAPTLLWETTDTSMGYTWSPAALGHVYTGPVQGIIPVVFVGGGYDKDNGANKVYIIDARDGSIKKSFTVGSAGNNVPSGILTIRYSLLNGVPVDYTTTPRVTMEPVEQYDENIEVAYFGDTSGTLWRIGPDEDWSGGLNSKIDPNTGAYTNWYDNVHLVKLYDPSEDQPIYHKPTVVDYPAASCRFVLFGTGNELDHNDPSQQYFVEVKDRQLTSDDADANVARMTWRTGEGDVEPIGVGEHVLSSPSAYKGKVYFTTYKAAPIEVAADKCSPEIGDGYLYGMTVSTCSSPGGDDGMTETDPDTGETSSTSKKELGKGFPTSPRISSPKITVIQTQDGSDGSGSLPIIKQDEVEMDPAKVLMWREMD